MTDRKPSQALSKKTQKLVQAVERLDTDAKLGLLYFVYEDMGDSVTPAAPTAAEPELAPKLLGDYYELSDEQQLAIMREIVNRDDTEYSRTYGSLKENNQLMVWYAWAQGMGDTIVDLPEEYETTDEVDDILAQIEELEFEEQISVLRAIVGGMGYTDVQPIASQAETGKTSSL